jgi:D-cysteine desulfhydrase
VKAPPRLELARLPTPVQPLDRLSDRWGGPRLFVKRDDLTGSLLTGNKIRKLEFSLGEARAMGARTVLTCGGIQSNHCRATAVACARLGLRCVVYLRTTEADPEPVGNHLLDVLVGAEVRFVTPEEYRRLGPTDEGYWIPEGASNEVGMWGYVHACAELTQRPFDALVHAVGSGGTTAGLIAGKAIHGLETPLVGVCVCDDGDRFYAKIEGILRAARVRWPDLPSLPPVREAVEILDGFQGRGYALDRPEEWALLHEVAESEGLVLDPVYTVKAMMGLRQAIRDGRFTKGQEVLFLHTGGIFSLFAYHHSARFL